MEYVPIKTDPIWVKELPSSCPECHNPLKDKSFTSKKGEKWNKVVCEDCELQWIKSKPKKSAGNGNALIMDELVAFRKEMNDRLDAMGLWLSKHIK